MKNVFNTEHSAEHRKWLNDISKEAFCKAQVAVKILKNHIVAAKGNHNEVIFLLFIKDSALAARAFLSTHIGFLVITFDTLSDERFIFFWLNRLISPSVIITIVFFCLF